MPLINYIGNRQEALAGGIGGFVRGNAPTPPSMSIDYLVVGGGTSGGGGSHGNAAFWRTVGVGSNFCPDRGSKPRRWQTSAP